MGKSGPDVVRDARPGWAVDKLGRHQSYSLPALPGSLALLVVGKLVGTQFAVAFSGNRVADGRLEVL